MGSALDRADTGIGWMCREEEQWVGGFGVDGIELRVVAVDDVVAGDVAGDVAVAPDERIWEHRRLRPSRLVRDPRSLLGKNLFLRLRRS